MRINKYVASATGMGRRAADIAIAQGRVLVNGTAPQIGHEVGTSDSVTLDGRAITPAVKSVTVMLNKPAGYVVSRAGQGSTTIYDLLPPEYRPLKPVGRLDKDSSGLLLLTTDGKLANELTHPRYAKTKIYEVGLDKPLTQDDKAKLDKGVVLEYGVSRLQVTVGSGQGSPVTSNLSTVTSYRVTMSEGRNRQIRRTFAALGYKVMRLHRTHLGNYTLGALQPGAYRLVTD